MLRFCAHSERETKEAGLQSHSQHIRWIQHIDWAVLRIQSIGQDAIPLPRWDIQRWEAVHSTKSYRRGNLEQPVLQICHRETQTHRQAANQRWKFRTSTGGAIGWRFTSGSSKAKEGVKRTGWSWDVTWRCMEASAQRKSPKLHLNGGRVYTIGSQRWGNDRYDSPLPCSCDVWRSWGRDRWYNVLQSSNQVSARREMGYGDERRVLYNWPASDLLRFRGASGWEKGFAMSLGSQGQAWWSRQCAVVEGQASLWRKSPNWRHRLPGYRCTDCSHRPR